MGSYYVYRLDQDQIQFVLTLLKTFRASQKWLIMEKPGDMSIVDPLTNTVIPSALYSNTGKWPDGIETVADSAWHRWFAWYPVEIHGDKVWGKMIYRKKHYIWLGIERGRPYRTVWWYGNIFDVLS